MPLYPKQLYKLLTQAIIVLGRIRESILVEWTSPKWKEDWEVRKDRTFYASNHESFACCDCGLTHLALPLDGKSVIDPSHKFVPVRPKNYDYSFRWGAIIPSEFVDESQK